MTGDNFVEVLLEKEKPHSKFLEKLAHFDTFSSEELVRMANLGQQNRQGEIEFDFSPEDRLIMYLIIACRINEKENISSIKKELEDAIYWALPYLEISLYKILFCIYEHPTIRLALWRKSHNKLYLMRDRCLSFEDMMNVLKKAPYFPEKFFDDLDETIKMLETLLVDLPEKEAKISRSYFEKAKQTGIWLKSLNRPFPPQLPPLKKFLSTYLG